MTMDRQIYLISSPCSGVIFSNEVTYIDNDEYMVTRWNDFREVVTSDSIVKLNNANMKCFIDSYLNAKRTGKNVVHDFKTMKYDADHDEVLSTMTVIFHPSGCIYDVYHPSRACAVYIPLVPVSVRDFTLRYDSPGYSLLLSKRAGSKVKFRNTYTKHHSDIFDYIRDNPCCTYLEISSGINRSKEFVLKRLCELIDAGRIEVSYFDVNRDTHRPISRFKVC